MDAAIWLPPVSVGLSRWQFPLRPQTLPAVAVWISGWPIDPDRAAAVVAADLSLMASASLWSVQTGRPATDYPASLADQYRRMDALAAPPPVPEGWTIDALLQYFHRPGGPALTTRLNDFIQHFGPPVVDFAKNPSPQLPPTPTPALSPTDDLIALARSAEQATQTTAAIDRRVAELRIGLAQRLAYGLSHEINNPLANIATRAATIARQTDGAIAASAQRIVDQSHRAHAMIADLMFFAQPPSPTLCPVNSAQILADVETACGAMASAAGTTLRRIDIPSQTVTADADLLTDAIASLVVNAIEAIGGGGVIELSVSTTNNQITFRVADSGPGVSATIAKIAADPYYCGREAGRGLGLGLTKAAMVARLHGGSLTIHPALAGCVVELTIDVG